jgi:hypothetical protein
MTSTAITKLIIENVFETLVTQYQIKAKFIEEISIGQEFNLKLKKSTDFVGIVFSNLKASELIANKMKTFENYKVKITYVGEFTEQNPGKSFLCKRTAEELEIINAKKNPCTGCELSKCKISECIAYNRLFK